MGPNLRYLLEMMRRYPLADRAKEVRNLLPLIERGLLNEGMAAAVLMQIQPLIEQLEQRPNYLVRAPEYDELYPDGPPELVVGHLEENEEVPLGLFPRGAFHCLFVGKTGGGKSVAIRRLVASIEQLNQRRENPIVVLILDYMDTSFLDFPGLFGSHWRCYDALGALRLGLQPPPGVPVTVWVNHIATSFCARAGLIAAWATMANEMRWLAAAMNPRPDEELLFPDFQLLLDVANELPGKVFARKTQYLESYIQCLEGITQASGDLFRTFNGLDPERDLIGRGHSAVFSVGNLSPPWLNQFVGDWFILHLLLGRAVRKHRCSDPEVLLIMDDCDAIVSKDNERLFLTGMPPIVQGLRLLRKLGVGISLGAGAMSPVSEQILNSVTYQFVFKNPHDDNASAAKRTLGLPPGNETLIQTLRPGECVVRLPGPWSHAILGNIDCVPLDTSFTPRYEAHQHVPAQRLEEMPDLLDALGEKGAEYRRTRQRQERAKHGRLRSIARNLLYQASLHPYWPVIQLYRLGEEPSSEVQKAVREELDDGGYATFVDVRVGRRYLALIELKDPAWSLLGKPPIELRGRGDLPHRCYAHWQALLGERRGFKAVVEWRVPGSSHDVDVAWKIAEGSWDVFEVVATFGANLAHHLEAAFLTPGSPVIRATVVAAQKKMLANLKRGIDANPALGAFREQIAYLPVEEVVRELWP
jgi:hypothetical protein